jgi:YbbR domain-containing protein
MIVKKLPIYVSIEGSPMKGHSIALDKIIVTPSHSVLAGSPAVLENLSYIPTEPVNIEGANGAVRRNVKIMPIPKCKAGYEGFVSVTVPIVKDKRVSAQ